MFTHEIQADKAFGKLSGFAFGLLPFECVDELDGREEANLATMVLDSLHTKGCRGMSFASPRATDQHDVLGASMNFPR